MNELEFNTWLQSATLSALGVQRKTNEDAALALLATKDAAGNPKVISPEELTQAETLSNQNEKIKARETELKEIQNRGSVLANRIAAEALQNRTAKTETMPLGNGGQQSFAQPKSIGKLTVFHSEREVLRRDGRREVLSGERRAYELGTFILGAVAGNEFTRRQFQQRAMEMGYEYLTMNEGTVGAGGYLVPPEFSADFIYLQQYYGVARKYARNVAVSSNDYRQPRMQSGVSVAWEGELSTIAASQMGIDQVQVLLKRLSSLVSVSNELNADSIIGLTEWLVKDSVRQMGQKEDDAFFNGDGTLAYGNTVGIIPGLLAVGSNAGVVLQGTGTAWTAVVNADIEKLMGALPMFPGMNPKLFCSNAYYRNVLRTKLVNAGGTNLIMLAQGGTPYQYDGVEVVISQVLPNTDPGTGTISLLYGDPEFSSTFVSKGEYTVFQANQGDTNVSTNTTTIRIDERVGMVNHELGSSTLAGAMVGLKSN